MNLINTLKNNWRDIVVGIAVTVIAAVAADVVNNLSIKQDGLIWLANVAAVLTGAAKFFAANMVAFLCFSVAWPTVNKFSNDSFTDVWRTEFSLKEKLITAIAVASAYVIAASIALAA
jgi:hypothetical protein